MMYCIGCAKDNGVCPDHGQRTMVSSVTTYKRRAGIDSGNVTLEYAMSWVFNAIRSGHSPVFNTDETHNLISIEYADSIVHFVWEKD